MDLLNKLIVWVLPLVPKSIIRKVSSRYIAGDSLHDAARCVRMLNQEGAMATVDVLGEYITNIDEADENMRYSCEVIRTIAREKIDSNLSIKLTSLGLGLDNTKCEANVREILETAKEHGNILVRFDMEDSHYTTLTIDLYDTLRKEFSNVGIVLQAYLRRTEADIQRLCAGGFTHVRLCKGIYIEPEDIAFKGRDEIRENFAKCLDLLFSQGAYVGIATHDEVVVDSAKQIINKHTRGRDQYEFQMLLGVRESMRRTLIKEGHRLRVYVPFGADWYGYSVRRLKENPSVAGHVVKAMFTKG